MSRPDEYRYSVFWLCCQCSGTWMLYGLTSRCPECNHYPRSKYCYPSRCHSCAWMKISEVKTPPELNSATGELVELLLYHYDLHPLYIEAIKRVDSNEFERHLRRFLRDYGRSLKTEAQNERQRHVSKFIRQSAGRVARKINLAVLNSTEIQTSSQQIKERERLNDWLIVEESDWDSEDSVEADTLYALDEVKNFLTSAQAFTALCQSLKSWLKLDYQDFSRKKRPLGGDVLEPMHNEDNPIDDGDKMTTWSLCWLWLMNIYAPPPFGFQRISYICGCGEPSYLDVRELSPGGITNFRKRLLKSTQVARTAPRNGLGSYQPTTLPQEAPTPDGNVLPPGVPHSQLPALPQDQGSLDSQDSPEGQDSPKNQESTIGQDSQQFERLTQSQELPQYLHLCVNRKTSPIMSSIEIGSLGNDQYLFQNILREYQHVREEHEWKISLLIPSCVCRLLSAISALLAKSTSRLFRIDIPQKSGHIRFHKIASGDFVQFQLIPIREECCPGRFKTRVFPPEDEVLKGRYLYAPVPMEDVEVAEIPLQHLLKPGPHTDQFWITTFPKKLGQPLSRQAGTDQRIVGWGVRINEGLNWSMILLSMLVALLTIGAVVVLYAIMTSDRSSAFGLGAYLIAVLTIYTNYQYVAWVGE